MHYEALHIQVSPELSLKARYYAPTDSPNQVLLIGSAMGVAQKFYAPFAAYISQSGIGAYTFDYRSQGESAPSRLRGYKVRLSQLGQEDLDAMLRYIHDQHPQAELIYVGHSLGAQLPALTPASLHIKRLLFVAGIIGYWRLWPRPRRYGFAFAVHVLLPLLSRLWGYFPGKKIGLFGNLPAGVAIDWARWCRQPQYLFAEFENAYLPQLAVPLRAYTFSDDDMGPHAASEALLQYYSAAEKEHLHRMRSDYDRKAIGHFGFFRSKSETQLWPEVLSWLKSPRNSPD